MAADDIRNALEALPFPIAVVTVGRGGVDNGLTVSWLAQASFEPPLLAFSVDPRHYSEELLRSTRTFVVNVLSEGQKELAARFAGPAREGVDKFAGLATSEAPSGGRVLDDALAWLDCEVEAIHPTGDHLLVVGRVVDARSLKKGPALTTSCGLRYRKSKP